MKTNQLSDTIGFTASAEQHRRQDVSIANCVGGIVAAAAEVANGAYTAIQSNRGNGGSPRNQCSEEGNRMICGEVTSE